MIKNLLKNLSKAVGVAGDEAAASEKACELLKKYIPDSKVDPFGNVTGNLHYGDDLPVILLDAHIDEIGFVVTFIDDNGFIKVGKAGGADTRVLPAQTVTVWGKKPIKGIVCSIPPHLKSGDDNKAVKIEDVAIDTGYNKEELEKLVFFGDKITVDGEFENLLNNRVSGRAFDNRAGVASILYALELIKNSGKKPIYNIKVIFSSQEELGCRGAKIGGYNAEADFAIVVDVSYGAMPGCDETKTGKLGKGVMLGIAPSLDKRMFDKMKELAERENIFHQIEVMAGRTGTNACEISVSRSGVRCALLSIPERNMHMPVEVLEISDIEAVSKLIAAYISEVQE